MYELTENLTENSECCKLLQFLQAEFDDMSAEEVQEVEALFKISSKSLYHEAIINTIIDYGKSHSVFTVITYVSIIARFFSFLILHFQNSEHNPVKEPFVSISCLYTISYHRLRPNIIEDIATLDDSKRWLETSLESFAKDDGHGHHPEPCIPAFVPQCCEVAVQNDTGKYFISPFNRISV